MAPWGAEFLPTVKNQVARNESEAVAGVGLGEGEGIGEGEGAGLGDGIGVGVGVGCMLLETEPQPARNKKSPVNKTRMTVRTNSSLERELLVKKGERR